jgi:hypothetical protein
MKRCGVFAEPVVASLLVLAMSAVAGPLVYGSVAGPRATAPAQASQQTAAQASNSPAQSEASATAAPASAGSATRSITLTFDYDFTKTPACTATVKTQCVAQFSVYDISGHKPYFLFSAPVPEGAHGVMKGIKATSPKLLFAVGKHRIAVSAREPNGVESPPHECKTIVEITATSPEASSGTN